jgi:hypothetical protein
MAATQDENTIILKSKKSYEQALKMKAEIERLMVEVQRPQSGSAGSISRADEIAKLADLRDRGAISEKQFEAERDRLLEG